MGYTQYWVRPRELDAERFALFSAACRDACADLAESLTKAVFSDAEVCFEGNPGCEPFFLERVSSGRVREGSVSEFCKTQKLPYDVAVARCVDLLKEYFPEGLKSKSLRKSFM